MQQIAAESDAKRPSPWALSPLGTLAAKAPALFETVRMDDLYDRLIPAYFAASETLSLEPDAPADEELELEHGEMEFHWLRGGARARVVTSVPLGHYTPAGQQLRIGYTALGGQLRRTGVPTRLLVADRSRVFLAGDPGDVFGSILTSTHPAAVSVAVQTFAACWRKGHDLLAPDPNRERQRAVLRLLSDGLTDGQVAERLSVSVRTVARVVENLQTNLGASGRFQLALLAQRNGLLD